MYYEAIDYWNSPDSYLEHHGVKGMKWGVRHDPEVDRFKSRIRDAKKSVRVARRSTSIKEDIYNQRYGITSRESKARAVLADRKAELAKYKGGDKAEINSYAKSYNSPFTDKTSFMRHIRTKKGQAYAEKVYKQSDKRMMRYILGGSAVIAGAVAVAAIMASKTPTKPLTTPKPHTFNPATFNPATFNPASFNYDTFNPASFRYSTFR